MNPHIRLAIDALEFLKSSATAGAAKAFREHPEWLSLPWEGHTVMEEYQAEEAKVDAAIAYLKTLEG